MYKFIINILTSSKLGLSKGKHSRLLRHRMTFLREHPNFDYGNNTYGVPKINNWDKKSHLSIGSYSSIARNVQIFMGGYHRIDWVTSYPFPYFFKKEFQPGFLKTIARSKGDVIIGSDVWLCRNSTIMSGVKVGHGAVVGAHAVVTKNVEPYSIVAGNPAKHIRWRFDEPTRTALLASAWWDWPEEEVLSVAPLLCSDDISAFLDYAKSRNQQT